jgi:hypothetical protein
VAEGVGTVVLGLVARCELGNAAEKTGYLTCRRPFVFLSGLRFVEKQLETVVAGCGGKAPGGDIR